MTEAWASFGRTCALPSTLHGGINASHEGCEEGSKLNSVKEPYTAMWAELNTSKHTAPIRKQGSIRGPERVRASRGVSAYVGAGLLCIDHECMRWARPNRERERTSAVLGVDAREEAHEGRLARAIRAEDADLSSQINAEGDVAQDLLAAGDHLAHLVEGQDGRARLLRGGRRGVEGREGGWPEWQGQ